MVERHKLPNVFTRTATEADLPAILSLHAELQPADPLPVESESGAVFAEILQRPGLEFVLLLDDDHEVLGSIYVNVIPNLTRGLRPYAVIENVILRADLRGRGLGKPLMAAALDLAQDAGCYKVMLLTGSSNPDTHAFYRSCGFDGDAKQGYLIRW
jgi:GNAT superfamily N-acetyltransferase